jgi:hypothetical protein
MAARYSRRVSGALLVAVALADAARPFRKVGRVNFIRRHPRTLTAIGTWVVALAVWPILVAVGKATGTAHDRAGAPTVAWFGRDIVGLLDIGFLAFTLLIPLSALVSVALPATRDVFSARFRVSSRFVKVGRSLGWVALAAAFVLVAYVVSEFVGYFVLYPTFLAWLH